MICCSPWSVVSHCDSQDCFPCNQCISCETRPYSKLPQPSSWDQLVSRLGYYDRLRMNKQQDLKCDHAVLFFMSSFLCLFGRCKFILLLLLHVLSDTVSSPTGLRVSCPVLQHDQQVRAEKRQHPQCISHHCDMRLNSSKSIKLCCRFSS